MITLQVEVTRHTEPTQIVFHSDDWKEAYKVFVQEASGKEANVDVCLRAPFGS